MGDSPPRKRMKREADNTLGIDKLSHTSRTGQIFMIHLTQEMLANERNSYFYQCLENFMQILKLKLARNRDDWMGLMVCNVEGNDIDNNILVIQKCEAVNIDMFTRVMEAYNRDVDYYENLIASTYCPMALVFQHVSREFGGNIPFMITRTFILETCVDHPAPNDVTEQHQIRVWAKNYKDLHIHMMLVGFGDNWNYETFYKDFEEILEAPDGQYFKRVSLPELETEMTRRARVVGNLELRISENSKVKVALQNFISQRMPMKSAYMSAVTNEPLEQHRQWSFSQRIEEDEFDADDDLDAEENIFDMLNNPQSNDILVKTCCGGREFLFPAGKINWMRKSRPRGIDIIGFKARPDDEEDKLHLGSVIFVGCHCSSTNLQAQFFSSLLHKMNQKNVIAVCAATLREYTPTRLWIMSPCMEYGGFYLYRVPFAENVRDAIIQIGNEYDFTDKELPVTENQAKAMKKIAKYLRLSANPISIVNPRLLRQRIIVESLALDIPRDEIPPDDTLPPDEMANRLQTNGLIDKFNEVFPTIAQNKKDNNPEFMDRAFVEQVLRDKTYMRYTVDKLKCVLRTLELPITGRKADLIKLIDEYRNKNLIE